MSDPFVNLHFRPKRVLALDLATKTGYAYNDCNTFRAGTVCLQQANEITDARKLRMNRRRDGRIARLHQWLTGPEFYPDIVVFEDVEFQSYTQQCQLWSSLRAALWLAFSSTINVECVPVATLKKFATGHGGATKEMMALALTVQHPNRFRIFTKKCVVVDTVRGDILDDNAVDAIWLWLWAQLNLCRTS